MPTLWQVTVYLNWTTSTISGQNGTTIIKSNIHINIGNNRVTYSLILVVAEGLHTYFSVKWYLNDIFPYWLRKMNSRFYSYLEFLFFHPSPIITRYVSIWFLNKVTFGRHVPCATFGKKKNAEEFWKCHGIISLLQKQASLFSLPQLQRAPSMLKGIFVAPSNLVSTTNFSIFWHPKESRETMWERKLLPVCT